MTSPLNSYANPGGEVYLSDQPAFQKMQNDIQGAADKVMANFGDDDMEAHLKRRVGRREDRALIRSKRENRDGTSKFGDDQKFLDKTQLIREKGAKVTKKISQKLLDYEADVIAFATDKDGGKARLQAKYPLGKPRKSTT
jgi:hypothetical protein